MNTDGTTVDKEGKSGIYDWALLEIILEAQKMVYSLYDRLAGLDQNARLAAKKLRQRIMLAIETTKKAIVKL